jgi:hypothetical protein
MAKAKNQDITVSFSNLLQKSGIDFTHTVIDRDTGTRLNYDFDISPQEFLSFAKADKRVGGKRGKVNALSNAKRAIDSQIDRVFMAIGYKLDPLPEYFSQFAKDFCEEKMDVPLKLRVISAFGMAPAAVISDIRNLRNKTEHEYEAPSDLEVKSAVEIAELFLSATELRLMVVWDFRITDSKLYKKEYITGICFNLSSVDHTIESYCYDALSNTKSRCVIEPNLIEHALIMRLCFLLEQEEEVLETLRYILRHVDHPIPSTEVKIVHENPHTN